MADCKNRNMHRGTWIPRLFHAIFGQLQATSALLCSPKHRQQIPKQTRTKQGAAYLNLTSPKPKSLSVQPNTCEASNALLHDPYDIFSEHPPTPPGLRRPPVVRPPAAAAQPPIPIFEWPAPASQMGAPAHVYHHQQPRAPSPATRYAAAVLLLRDSLLPPPLARRRPIPKRSS